MPDYSRSKIYKIVSDQTDDVYYGATTRPYLSQRMNRHREDFKKWEKSGDKKDYQSTSFEILKYNDAKIILVENCHCTTKDELVKKEKFWIENNECVNKQIPGGCGIIKTREKNRKRAALDYPKNKGKISAYHREHYLKNKEKLKEKQRVYYQENREELTSHIKKKRHENNEKCKKEWKDYRDKNKEKLNEYRRNLRWWKATFPFTGCKTLP